MHTDSPICITKCHQCVYYYTDSCVAIKGDNFFLMVKEKQLDLLIKNKYRFNLTEKKLEQLNVLFPNN